MDRPAAGRGEREVSDRVGKIGTKKIKQLMAKSPLALIENFVRRLESHLNDLRQDKENKIADWKQTCEVNFLKSLDHRSFFFKKEQKDRSQVVTGTTKRKAITIVFAVITCYSRATQNLSQELDGQVSMM